jgi:hypothetical protein
MVISIVGGGGGAVQKTDINTLESCAIGSLAPGSAGG